MEFMIGDAAASPPQAKNIRPATVGLGAPIEVQGRAGELRREAFAGKLRPVPLPLRLTGEAVSILAMALATLAIGMALHLQIGMSAWSAAMAAVFCYAAMLVMHALMPRHYPVERVPAAGTIQRASRNLGADREAKSAHAPGHQPVTQHSAQSARQPIEATSAGSVGPAAPPRMELPQSQPARNEAPAAIRSTTRVVPPPMRHVGDDGPRNDQQFNAPPPSPAAQPMGGAQRQAHAPASAPVAMQAKPVAKPLPVAEAASPREADVEMIQGLIRKLADEVNAASASPPRGAEAAAVVSERAISTSLDALKATAGRMRSQDEAAQRRKSSPVDDASDARRTESGRPPEVNARLSALAEALALGRVEVLLDPIVDFNAGRPRHFELYVRLRDERGRVLDTDRSREDFAGTGMLPRIDGARIAHASQIAVRFTGRGRDNALFSTVSGEALSAHKFLEGVAQAYRERRSVAGVLVMTFSQADVGGFGPREWHALTEFASIGFRYCVAEVMDLDMDFEDLKSRGFDFVKLDAGVFLEGLPAGNDVFVPAQDVCKHLAGLGLSVIVGGMTNEATAAKVFGFGVLFGQGTLFGGAKAVRRELLEGGGHAAA